jgi:hypothetical protein
MSIALLLLGCASPPPAAAEGTGRLSVRLHDGPSDAVDEVWIAWDEVRANHDVMGWVTLSDEPGSVDLLTLRDGEDRLLGDAIVPGGHYSQLRLHLTDAWVVDDGQRLPLDVPSGETSGLKLIHGFAVDACTAVVVSIDWDTGAHLSDDSGGWKLRPTLVATVAAAPADGGGGLSPASDTDPPCESL